jgi:hypothetical protein
MTINEEIEEAKKHAGGRPLKFETPEQLQEAINAYYSECEIKEKPLSLSGLAEALDIARKTLVNYSYRDEFLPTIEKARRKVERDNEERLIGGKGNATGIIFSMKNNFGWVDKTEVESRMTLKQALVGFDDGNSQSNDTNEV